MPDDIWHIDVEHGTRVCTLDFSDFWTDENVAALRQIAESATAKTYDRRISYRALCTIAKDQCGCGNLAPSDTWIRKFINKPSRRSKPTRYSCLLLSLRVACGCYAGLRERLCGEQSNFTKLIDDFDLAARKSPTASGSKSSTSANKSPPDNPNLDDAIASVTQMFQGIAQANIMGADGTCRKIFGSNYLNKSGDVPPRAFFDTIRYSVKPGWISRSLTVITAPGPIPGEDRVVPVPHFLNIFQDDEVTRYARGFVLDMEFGVFLFGYVLNEPADPSSAIGMKVMAFDNFSMRRKTIYGLAMSCTTMKSVVSGKIAMIRRNDISHHKQLPTGRFSEKDEKVVSQVKTIHKGIRNKIKFHAGEDFIINGKKFDQNGMVAQVGEWASANDVRIGSDNKSRPFNPAADVDYTFNSCLKL